MKRGVRAFPILASLAISRIGLSRHDGALYPPEVDGNRSSDSRMGPSGRVSTCSCGLTVSLPYPYPPVVAPVGGELGFGYRLNRDPGMFVQPAIEGSFANAVFLRGSHAFGPDRETSGYTHSGSMDLGARLAPSGTHAPGGSNCD
jgi:hypothetical protein